MSPQTKIRTVVIIGSGNVATCLGVKLASAGIKILQVLSRNENTSSQLANRLNASAVNDYALVAQDADAYIITVQDANLTTAIGELSTYLSKDKVVIHTTGSASIDTLNMFDSRGVFYPLQSLRKEIAEEVAIPLFIDANTKSLQDDLCALASLISETVGLANDEKRISLHIAAVFVSNFTNYIYALGEKFCKEHAIDFNSLTPIIQETANRLSSFTPSQVQTGPAIRNDVNTIENHKNILQSDAELQDVYQFLTERIMKSGLFK